MIDRYTKVAFKQMIKKEWLDKTLELVCAGFSEAEIRNYLNNFLKEEHKKDVADNGKGEITYLLALSMLAFWFRTDDDLNSFRNALTEVARKTQPSEWLPLHMAIISAGYPFYFNFCSIVGKLLSYQDVISSSQIYDKVNSLYGDKKSVVRNTRYAVDTMASWGFIVSVGDKKRNYKAGDKFEINNPKTQALLYESVLLTKPTGKALYEEVYRNPALFGFQYDYMSSAMVEKLTNGRVHMLNYGLTTEYLCLDNAENL